MIAGLIPEPPPNTRAHPYRGLSLQEVDIPLTERSILSYLDGREVYRRTDFLALRNGADVALVEVRKASLEPLFAPVVDARVVSGPAETAWVHDADVDVGNATALAGACVPGALTTVVLGRFEHVNFLHRPQPIPVRVTEVVPPEPPKLLEQARQAVAFDEDLPPVELLLDAVRVEELAAAHPSAQYLLPCRGSGVELGAAELSFLDTRPAERADWLLIGCERSLQFHRHFYGDEPQRVDLCPRSRPAAAGRALMKCCLLERGLELGEQTAVVPWGANLDEVREGLRKLLL
ncbi:DUF7714 family protein [Pseudonocardia sp. GCM10023141]|uniref:DUF7714 family protein n=1 Tax=Pseudonocardia sp. GCM10023141 TaxID=3252653 RepID=UPI0036148E4F